MTATAEFPRQFVAPADSFGEWPTAERYYRELLERPVSSLADFEKWMRDFSETDAIFDEEGTGRHIDMTRAMEAFGAR